MEPKLPAPHQGPDRIAPYSNQRVENFPSLTVPEKSLEHNKENIETGDNVGDRLQTQPTLPTLSSAAPFLAQDDDTKSVTQDNTSAPLVAADDDLIEKEWVDKAKTIVVQTKDDPYRREQEVSKLQTEYLRKRYGKELGAS